MADSIIKSLLLQGTDLSSDEAEVLNKSLLCKEKLSRQVENYSEGVQNSSYQSNSKTENDR